MTPSDVRRPVPARAAERHALRVVLDVRPPFDREAALSFLRARAVVGAEAFVGDTYVRAATVSGKSGLVTMAPAKERDAIVVEVSTELAASLMNVAARARRMFDTDADTVAIGAHLARDPMLKRHITLRPALRVMGAFDPFEWAVRAVLGQQVSVRAALTIASRLVAKLGTPVASAPGLPPLTAWPDAARIAEADESIIASIGLTRARATTVRGLARAVADGRLILDRGIDLDVTREALLSLPGIGPWTADYIAMRALGWPDAFPAGDLGLRKALGGVSSADCEARSERWRPWRAYAAAHLWVGTAEVTG